MTKKGKFAIPTLVAAGLAPLSVSADDNSKAMVDTDGSHFDRMRNIATSIDESHSFTLAQHQSHLSHGSHGSHGSHQSHRSYSYQLHPGDGVPETAVASATTRNEMSTPPSSILPSSPAIAKKLKILPGHSEKFRDLVTRAQIALLAKGYQVGEVNGDLHARTIAALYNYQQDAGQIPSGKLTNEVLSSLGIIAQ